MSTRQKKARIAGLLYLVMAAVGAFSLLYVPNTLIRFDDAVETVQNIRAHEQLFRYGIVAELACQVIFIFLVLALHRLLRDVDPTYAATMVALVIASVPVAFLNMLNQMAALVLLSGKPFLAAFSTDQLNALVMTFLELHDYGMTAVEIFWGLWLFPFGVLVYRSRFLPRVLGALLIFSCFAYVAHSLTTLLMPQLDYRTSSILGSLGGVGEFAVILWLVIRGAAPEESSVR